MNMICIVCPNGCELCAERKDGKITVTGNKCPRGEAFAVSELTSPVRTVCSTVRTAFPSRPVLPVRTSGEIPKDKVFPLMRELENVVQKDSVKRGDAIIRNVLGLGVDIIATDELNEKAEESR